MPDECGAGVVRKDGSLLFTTFDSGDVTVYRLVRIVYAVSGDVLSLEIPVYSTGPDATRYHWRRRGHVLEDLYFERDLCLMTAVLVR